MLYQRKNIVLFEEEASQLTHSFALQFVLDLNH